ncbi:MAG: DUF4097 family beta strand repeat-containing protein [Sedimentisphaerales bacterium]
MKRSDFPKASVGFLLYLLIAATDCFCAGGCIPRAKYERIVHLSAPLPAGSLFEAQTHNGYITITGTDVADCNLIATITARADTEENAQKLAEEVKVELISSGNKLTAKIEKPELTWGESIGVSLDITVPNQTSADLTTHNGTLKIKNLTGQLNGTTHNGEVVAEKISGTAKLKTHNGSLICEEASDDINLRTHNGNAKTFYSRTASPVCNVSIVTHNGNIDLTAPPNFSAKVEASTHNGLIDIDLPITVTGNVTKNKLSGTIGTGQGELYLETHNGSIKIK